MPWYKQFWPWFLILLPLSAVIGSITTLIVFSNNSVEVVVDDYYKKGKAINMDLQQFDRAKALNLSFRLSIEDDIIYLDNLAGELSSKSALTLNFTHPTIAAQDFSLLLASDAAGRYSAEIDIQPKGKWQLLLQPFNSDWKIKTQAYFPLTSPLTLE